MGDQWRLFKAEFNIPGGAYATTGQVWFTADNSVAVYFNGVPIGATDDGSGSYVFGAAPVSPEPGFYANAYSATFTPIVGLNTLEFVLRNWDSTTAGSPWNTINPTGLLYKAEVSYEPPATVGIDIKPGSFPNSINLNDQGLLPVAILGSATLDVTTIDPASIYIGSVSLATRGLAKAPKLAFSYEDVNGDGYLDMMVFFKVQDLVTTGALTSTTAELTLAGYLYGGTGIAGTDSVRIVPS